MSKKRMIAVLADGVGIAKKNKMPTGVLTSILTVARTENPSAIGLTWFEIVCTLEEIAGDFDGVDVKIAESLRVVANFIQATFDMVW